MDMKKISFIMLLFSLVFANDCVVPYDDMVISGDVTLCPGTYNITDGFMGEKLDGVIIINDSHTHLDCNGATLVGNLTDRSIKDLSGIGGWGIVIMAKDDEPINDITIENCNLEYYGGAISVRIEDRKWDYCQSFDCLSDYEGIITDLEIKGNEISKCYDAITLSCVSDSKIVKNKIYDLKQSPIRVFNSQYMSISKNRISDTDGGIGLYRNSNHATITRNTLRDIQTSAITGWATRTYIANNNIRSDNNTGISISDSSCGREPDSIIIFSNTIKDARNAIVLHGFGDNTLIEANFLGDVYRELVLHEAQYDWCAQWNP